MSKNTKGSGNLTSISGGRGGGNNETPPPGTTKVIDFDTARAQRNQLNRRSVERFFLQNMVDAYCELNGERNLLPLELVEVSETGCSFRITAEKLQELPTASDGKPAFLPTRLYFSRDSFLRIGFNVVNVTTDISSGRETLRVGCQLDSSFASSETYRQFVKFMQLFMNHSSRDSKFAATF